MQIKLIEYIKYFILSILIVTFFPYICIAPSVLSVNNSTGSIGNYTSIQLAVNDAIDGDVIIVYPGIYHENILIDKEIVIKSFSENTNDTQIIALDSNKNVFEVCENNVTLMGFKISGSNGGASTSGLFMNEVENCTVSHNIFLNNTYGMKVYKSNDNLFEYNSLFDNFEGGIDVCLSEQNMFKENVMVKTGWEGIGLRSSHYNSLINNFVEDNSAGIFLGNSSSNTLEKNTALSNNGLGIILSNFSQNNTLSENIAIENQQNGISIVNSNNNLVIENDANNNQVGIFINSDNNVLEDNNFSQNLKYGTHLFYANYNVLRNNSAKHTISKDIPPGGNGDCYGIYLDHSNGNELHDNIANTNDGTGIYVHNSYYNLIQNNMVNSNNVQGIFLTNSERNKILDNTISYNYAWSMVPGHTCVGFYGINLASSNYNEINKNLVNNNGEAGIRISNSMYNTVNNSNFSNYWYGLSLSNTYDNCFYNNYFNNPSDVKLEGTNFNKWNITKTSGTNIIEGPFLGGNFWAHPDETGFSQTCEDLDSDGICDHQHILDGGYDYLPLYKKTSFNPYASVVPSTSGPFVPKDSFQVEVEINSTDYNLRAVGLKLDYDPEVFMVDDINDENLLGTGALVAPGSGDDGAGTITYGIASTGGDYTPIAGAMLTIEFEVKTDAADGTYILDLNNIVLKDETNSAIPGVMITDGFVEIFTCKKGDYDCNGVVNFDDFVEFAASYNSSKGDTNYELIFDFDEDNDVDFDDFVEFAGVYQT